ncbi:MAG: hypothetical protein R3B95_04575 [Nitrospirales bacterium]|nr:hypothetical protein [Nitrospirales bacterium]
MVLESDEHSAVLESGDVTRWDNDHGSATTRNRGKLQATLMKAVKAFTARSYELGQK